MSIATIETQPRVQDVEIIGNMLSIRLMDGRILSIPLAWYPRLMHANEYEREEWRVFEDSEERDIIFWESLDELIPVVALLAGVPSRESRRSLDLWLAGRSSHQTIQ